MYLSSDMLGFINQNTEFKLTLKEMPKQTFKGQIIKIVKRIDPASQSLLVYGKLINPPSDLFAGMSGIATFNLTYIQNKKAE